MQGETGANPVRARRREAHRITRNLTCIHEEVTKRMLIVRVLFRNEEATIQGHAIG